MSQVNIVEQQSSLVELIERSLNKLALLFEPLQSVDYDDDQQESKPSVLNREVPKDYQPIKFTCRNTESVADIEAMMDCYLIELHGHEYLYQKRRIFAQLPSEERIYNYILLICGYCEEQYDESSEFFESTFAEWRQLLKGASSKTIFEVDQTGGDCQSVCIPLAIRDTDLDILAITASDYKAEFTKFVSMFAEIVSQLHIPVAFKGAEFRYQVAHRYTVLCDRLNLLDHFQQCLASIKAELARVNVQFVSAKNTTKDENNASLDDEGRDEGNQ